MSFMKMRQLPPRQGFSDQAKRAAAASRGQRRGIVQGQFANFYPREERALWIAICPTQKWDYEAYNRDTREVVPFKEQYWYGYTEHRIAANKRRFVCSAGSHKSKPCWGCGVINAHWTWVRGQEEETGVKSDKKPAISSMQQFAMSIVLLEQVAKIPAKNPDGTTKMSRSTPPKPIMNDVALPLMDLAEQKKAKAEGITTFGLSMHWSNGITGINELQSFDRELQNSCANCAGDLKCAVMACPECACEFQVAEDLDEPLGGEDLLQAREAPYQCECGYEGVLTPILTCMGCDKPETGGLVYFALRVKNEKVSDTKRTLKIVEIKPLQYFVEKYPAVEEMLLKPLDIPAIFAPESLEGQTRLIPQNLRGDGVTAMPRSEKEPAAVSYEFNQQKRAAGSRNDEDTDE
jgi:hypothetical protein